MSLFDRLFHPILLCSMAKIRDDKTLVRIALVLKELRDELGVTQEEVFNDTNIHIARIESGRSNPTISTLSVLTEYFNIRLSEFFERVENKTE